MSAIGLRGIVPASILAGRWLAVLVCYLDDSGKDAGNAVTTVAGYVAREEDWAKFEMNVEPVFAEAGINILHTMDLHATKREFKGWGGDKKKRFVSAICQQMRPVVPLGLSMSALKSTYKRAAAETKRKTTVTPYTFCANVILDWILRDVMIGRAAHEEGLAFIVEAGNDNNKELEPYIHGVKKEHGLEKVIKSISFVEKQHSRAIQVADMLAFYSRRHAAAMEKAHPRERPGFKASPIMNIIGSSVPVRAFVAFDFADARPPSEMRFQMPSGLRRLVVPSPCR